MDHSMDVTAKLLFDTTAQTLLLCGTAAAWFCVWFCIIESTLPLLDQLPVEKPALVPVPGLTNHDEKQQVVGHPTLIGRSSMIIAACVWIVIAVC